MSTRLSIINTSARTGILKPSLRTISIASVPLLVPENYLQIPWYVHIIETKFEPWPCDALSICGCILSRKAY